MFLLLCEYMMFDNLFGTSVRWCYYTKRLFECQEQDANKFSEYMFDFKILVCYNLINRRK